MPHPAKKTPLKGRPAVRASPPPLRRVRVLINPHSGTRGFTFALLRHIEEAWSAPGVDVAYQISGDIEDGREKARRAVADGVDSVLVVGGDGMVNTIGSELIGSGVALGVIPFGSGNGFARHFEVPLDGAAAAAALARATRCAIDVGYANGHPFFVTCSLAWDAALVKRFEQSPVRGVFPYVLAGAYGLFEYTPHAFHARFDDGRETEYDNPMVWTVANLTQFGGGARIAPTACPDDGFLELVTVSRRDSARALANLPRLFSGTLDTLPEVHTERFRSLTVRKDLPSALQIDGELLPDVTEVEFRVEPKALTVLVPPPPEA